MTNVPGRQHLDEVCLGRSRLVAPLQPREDAVLLQQRPRRRTLDLDHVGLADIRPRRDGVKVQVLPQHDDAGSLGRVVPAGPHGLNGHHVTVLRRIGRQVGGDGLGDVAEKI